MENQGNVRLGVGPDSPPEFR